METQAGWHVLLQGLGTWRSRKGNTVRPRNAPPWAAAAVGGRLWVPSRLVPREFISASQKHPGRSARRFSLTPAGDLDGQTGVITMPAGQVRGPPGGHAGPGGGFPAARRVAVPCEPAGGESSGLGAERVGTD